MAGVSDVFEEHLGVVAALKENYTRHEDVTAIANIATLRDEVAQLCTAREDEVLDAIKGLTKIVASTESAATYPKDENAHKDEVQNITVQKNEANEEVQRLQAQLTALEADRQKLTTDFEQLRQKGDALEKLIQDVEPRTRHQMSLYAHISKITWQFDGADTVAGVVSDPDSGDIRHFNIEPESMSKFELTNHLWTLMESV